MVETWKGENLSPLLFNYPFCRETRALGTSSNKGHLRMWSHILAVISLWSCFNVCYPWDQEVEISQTNHHRSKRFLWMTHEKRLVWPPGTQLVLTPTLAMPLLRYPPTGIDANLTISTPFTSTTFLIIVYWPLLLINWIRGYIFKAFYFQSDLMPWAWLTMTIHLVWCLF